jgi:hypothetical protein
MASPWSLSLKMVGFSEAWNVARRLIEPCSVISSMMRESVADE